MPSHYPISVVIPSMRGWPRLSIALDSLLPQVRRVGGQLIVADGSNGPRPTAVAESDDVIWLSMPRATVFELRQAAYGRAAAEIICVTEDHCAPTDDWLSTILQAHADDPEAAVIFGAVENGSTEHAVDWALYCAGYGALAPPLPVDTTANPGHANTSWKKSVFERVPPTGERVLEFVYNAALRKSGARVVADDRLRVRHYQCEAVEPTMELFFHNGRAIAAIRRPYMAAHDWARVVAPHLLAGYRTARTLRRVWGKPFRGAALRATPYIALLHLAHAVGEGVGYVYGSGDSGRHLH